MVMMDSTSGKVLGSLCGSAQASTRTPSTRRTGYAFASSSDGTLTVASVDAAGKLAVVQKLATPPRTRTMTLDPATHRLYAAAAEYKAGTPGADGKPGRPTMVTGIVQGRGVRVGEVDLHPGGRPRRAAGRVVGSGKVVGRPLLAEHPRWSRQRFGSRRPSSRSVGPVAAPRDAAQAAQARAADLRRRAGPGGLAQPRPRGAQAPARHPRGPGARRRGSGRIPGSGSR